MRSLHYVAAVFASIGAAGAEPLTVPFDFSQSEIVLAITVKGEPVSVLLDTGVDPSAVDLALAEKLGLPLDKHDGGEAAGQGSADHAIVYPGKIENIAIAGRDFGSVDALASDLSPLSVKLGRPLGAVLGYSFLKDQAVLIDYAGGKATFITDPADAGPLVKTCRTRWPVPLKPFEDDAVPSLRFRFGKSYGLISLDTGSSGTLTLYSDALALPGVKEALVEKGVAEGTGARGTTIAKTYTLNLPVSFGPFTAPAGLTVAFHENKGFDDPRVANVGNKFFAGLGLKILFDYRAKRLSFFGGC
jgi:Predicted aspartyl protease